MCRLWIARWKRLCAEPWLVIVFDAAWGYGLIESSVQLRRHSLGRRLLRARAALALSFSRELPSAKERLGLLKVRRDSSSTSCALDDEAPEGATPTSATTATMTSLSPRLSERCSRSPRAASSARREPPQRQLSRRCHAGHRARTSPHERRPRCEPRPPPAPHAAPRHAQQRRHGQRSSLRLSPCRSAPSDRKWGASPA